MELFWAEWQKSNRDEVFCFLRFTHVFGRHVHTDVGSGRSKTTSSIPKLFQPDPDGESVTSIGFDWDRQLVQTARIIQSMLADQQNYKEKVAVGHFDYASVQSFEGVHSVSIYLGLKSTTSSLNCGPGRSKLRKAIFGSSTMRWIVDWSCHPSMLKTCLSEVDSAQWRHFLISRLAQGNHHYSAHLYVRINPSNQPADLQDVILKDLVRNADSTLR